MSYVHALFPTPVFEALLTEDVDDEFDRIVKNIENGTYKLNSNDGNNLISEDSYIIEQWNLDEIKKQILSSVETYAKNILSCRFEEIKITQSWLNVNPYGTSHSPHFHKNSVFSGVLYINTGENCGDIRFHKQESMIEIDVQFDPQNHFSWDFTYFSPKKYQLFIFPSHLIHSVSKNLNQDINRISLSFNTFLDALGSEHRRTRFSNR